MCAINGFSLHKCELKKKYQGVEMAYVGGGGGGGGGVLPQSCKKEIIKYKVQIKLILICCSTRGREGAPY